MEKTNANPGYGEKAARHGNKWLWGRIKGLRQQLKRGSGSSSEIAEKLAILEGILLQRAKQFKKAELEERKTNREIVKIEMLVKTKLPLLERALSKQTNLVLYAQRITLYGESKGSHHGLEKKEFEGVIYYKTINALKYPEKLEKLKELDKGAENKGGA